jgi:hypothetical protein
MSSRSALAFTLTCLLTTQFLAGCDTSDLVAQYPTLSPIIGPRPKAKPFSLARGHIAGRVVSTAGFPVGNAFVTTGGASTFSAFVPETEAELDTLTFVLNENNNLDRVYVEDASFTNDRGEEELVPAFRIIRKFPSGNSLNEKYYYLRNGEFLLEGIPEGEALVTASFNDVTAAAQRFTIFPNFLMLDTSFTLDIPVPLEPDATTGRLPEVVDWAGLEPETGLTVRQTVRIIPDPVTQLQLREVTVNYLPSENIIISLRSPPGSAGSFISAYELSYRVGNEERGTTRVPTSPRLVQPGGPRNSGPVEELEIPVGSVTLQSIVASFVGKNPPEDPPPIIVANIRFFNRQNQPIASSGASRPPLEVSVPLRVLSQ